MSEKKPEAAPAPTPEQPEGDPKAEAQDGPRPGVGGAGRSGLGSLFGAIMRRGRDELERAASQTRVRLDLRQLRRDREAMYAKVGREVRSLLEGGEIRHPGLERGVDRIREIEKKIADVEAEMASAGIPVEPEGEA